MTAHVLVKKHFPKRKVPLVPDMKCAACGSRHGIKISHGRFLCTRHDLQQRITAAKKDLQTFQNGLDMAKKIIARAEAELAALPPPS
jgi:hypothetical protein